jgi:hypothetical protein
MVCVKTIYDPGIGNYFPNSGSLRRVVNGLNMKFSNAVCRDCDNNLLILSEKIMG